MGTETTDLKPNAAKTIKESIQETHSQWKVKNTVFSPEDFVLIVDLLDCCLRISPEHRATSEKALYHPLFIKYKLKINHGSILTIPVAVPSSKVNDIFMLMRKDLIAMTVSNIKDGYMQYYPTVMAISIFDRVTPLLWPLLTLEGALYSNELQQLFCACYLLGMKLMTSLDSPAIFKQLQGVLCKIDNTSAENIIYYERVIIEKLHFMFYSGDIGSLPISTQLVSNLESKSFNLQTFNSNTFPKHKSKSKTQQRR
jgi:serine/threonine protein kinase